MKIEFPRAAPEQAAVLSDLAIRSKGHWGYSQEQLERWRKDLFVSSAYIKENFARTILREGDLVGFYALKKGRLQAVLDHLWVLSKAIGAGIGRRAFEQIRADCARLSIRELVIVSDPNAEGFYLRMGAERVGQVESVPQNRKLPKLRCCFDSVMKA